MASDQPGATTSPNSAPALRHLQHAAVLQQLRDGLRPGQQTMADWYAGPLAISAVPGAGKSTGMAMAAALWLGRLYQQEIETRPAGQLVLVTFTRSAVANLKAKINQYLQALSLAPSGFAVYTLHGLALHIATRHPDLSGLSLDHMTLVSPIQSHRLLRTCVEHWIAANPSNYQRLLAGRQFDGEETERLRRQSVLRTEVLPNLAHTVIHEAKSSGLQPEDLQELGRLPLQLGDTARYGDEVGQDDYDILAIAAGLYQHYQTLLQQRHLIDYDDMILAALRVLHHDDVHRLWQAQVFAVFEDEAQDSSPLQTQLLEILAAHPDDPALPLNLVRVGDPNQAINSTFTPADPIFFRQFCQQCEATGRLAEMNQAGRSSPIIMAAANFMLSWVNQHYGQASASQTSAPFRLQTIHPVAADDPQTDANPVSLDRGLELHQPRDIHHTVELIAQRVADLLTGQPELRAAILVRENRQGRFIAERLLRPGDYGLTVDLGRSGIEIYEVGQRDRHSHVPAEILTLLQFLDRPHSPDHLKAALRVLVDRRLIPTQDLNLLASLPEQFLYPGPLEPPQAEAVLQARRYCAGLLRARLELPQVQLIPFLALTLNYDQAELATADKLAERLAQQTAAEPSMAAMLAALGDIVSSERFEPVDTEDTEARYTRPGQITIITMHKAKGLDWDAVFLPFLHEQSIPGSSWIPPQAQFLGDFSLAEVARAQIRASIHQELPMPGLTMAWERAKYLKTAEEFRLLYVAMTRARRLLWMSAAGQAPFTWSKPDNLERQPPCPVLTALGQQFPEAVI